MYTLVWAVVPVPARAASRSPAFRYSTKGGLPGASVTNLGMLDMRLSRSGSHDQVVVRDGSATVERVHDHQGRADAEVHNFAKDYPGILLRRYLVA